jgi:hypothetical protein
MNFNFGEVLTRAWKIVWKHKVLWIFGILASCNSNRGSANFSNNSNYQTDSSSLPPQILEQINRLAENIWPIIAILVAVICVGAILSIFLGTMGRIGLIRGTVAADGDAEHLSFGDLFRESLPFFWRSFWLWFLVGLPFLFLGLLLVGVLGLGAFALLSNGADETAFLGILGMIPMVLVCSCIMGIFSWIIRLIAQQAQNAIVVEDLGTMPALIRGWDVFRQNLGAVIVLSLILGVIGFVIGLVIAIPVMMIVFPTVIAFAVGQGQSMTPLIILGLCMVAFIPVSLLINGIFSSYTEATWTLTYLRLTRKPEQPPEAPVVLAEANA